MFPSGAAAKYSMMQITGFHPKIVFHIFYITFYFTSESFIVNPTADKKEKNFI